MAIALLVAAAVSLVGPSPLPGEVEYPVPSILLHIQIEDDEPITRLRCLPVVLDDTPLVDVTGTDLRGTAEWPIELLAVRCYVANAAGVWSAGSQIGRITPRLQACDVNRSGACDLDDIFAVNDGIFGR